MQANQTLLDNIGLTDERKQEVINLLVAWSIEYGLGGNRKAIAIMTGQINASPTARFMRDSLEQSFEIGKGGDIAYQILFTNDCLIVVNQTMRGMKESHHKLYKALYAKYRWYEGLSDEVIAGRLKCTRMTYFNRVNAGYELFNKQMDWRLV